MEERKTAGYTIVELLVAMSLLVIAFALVTVLYVRASRIRRIITSGSEVQQVLNQMVSTIAYRDRNNVVKSLINATNLYGWSGQRFEQYLVFGNTLEDKRQYYWIAPGESEPSASGAETTLWYGEASSGPPSSWLCLDPNRHMTILPGSRFEFYDGNNTRLTTADKVEQETPIRVVIRLVGKSNDPSMKNRQPVSQTSSVRLRNRASF
ncbi:MAG: type II secretion system GspH family protein [Candidatus Omnitrophica bacterium]|nr:type II secretion system GspH family protein [Candidatus Omnitrophota bacterium]